MRKHYTFREFYDACYLKQGGHIQICLKEAKVKAIIEKGITPWEFLRSSRTRTEKAWVVCGLSNKETVIELLKDKAIVHQSTKLRSYEWISTLFCRLYYLIDDLEEDGKYSIVRRLLKKMVEIEIGKEPKQ